MGLSSSSLILSSAISNSSLSLFGEFSILDNIFFHSKISIWVLFYSFSLCAEIPHLRPLKIHEIFKIAALKSLPIPNLGTSLDCFILTPFFLLNLGHIFFLLHISGNFCLFVDIAIDTLKGSLNYIVFL